MSQSEEANLKRLAEMKAYLEKRISESQEEMTKLKSFLEVVDSLLVEKSFRRAEIPKPPPPPVTAPPLARPAPPPIPKVVARPPRPPEMAPLTTVEGVHLADLEIGDGDLRVVPDPAIRFDINSPPLRAFLIGRVLEPMQSKDREAARTGQLSPDRVLSYRLEQENNLLKELYVQNYGDERRLLELRNAIRWTLRRMYEKTLRSS